MIKAYCYFDSWNDIFEDTSGWNAGTSLDVFTFVSEGFNGSQEGRQLSSEHIEQASYCQYCLMII